MALSVPDRWILSRLASVTAQVDALFEEFEFGKLSELLYHFAWDEYCDWYLELAKVTLASGDEAAADRYPGGARLRARPRCCGCCTR